MVERRATASAERLDTTTGKVALGGVERGRCCDDLRSGWYSGQLVVDAEAIVIASRG